jgi:hypothetical protein
MIYTRQHLAFPPPLLIRRFLDTLQHGQPIVALPSLCSLDDVLRPPYDLLFGLSDGATHVYDSYDDWQVKWLGQVGDVCERRPDHFIVIARTPDYGG